MAHEINPYMRTYPAKPAGTAHGSSFVGEQLTMDVLSLALAWGSWAWCGVFAALELFVVEFHGGQTYYEQNGAVALTGMIAMMALLTIACVVMSVPRLRVAGGVLMAISTVAVLTSVVTLGPFLLPAAMGFALAAFFELGASMDLTG